MKLLELMTPLRVRALLLPHEVDLEFNDPVLIALGNRFADKYVLGFNGFTEFCNSKSSDKAFMDRAKRGVLTDADYTEMVQFFETHPAGGPFFADETEVDEFLKTIGSVSV
jgi:hypothetical protein